MMLLKVSQKMGCSWPHTAERTPPGPMETEQQVMPEAHLKVS